MKTETVKIQELQIEGITYVPKDSVQQISKSIEGLEYTIIRTYSAGVFAGYIKEIKDYSGSICMTLINARKLYYWEGAATLSQLATLGTSKPEKCKFTIEVPEQNVYNVIETIPISEISAKNYQFDKNMDSLKESNGSGSGYGDGSGI
jgi:hypothetical protein